MTTPRPASVPACTSMTSVLAVKNFDTRSCDSPLCKVYEDEKLGPYVYEHVGKEYIKTIDGEDFLVKKLVKKLLDPYGFTRPPPRPPSPCWFCSSVDVSVTRSCDNPQYCPLPWELILISRVFLGSANPEYAATPKRSGTDGRLTAMRS